MMNRLVKKFGAGSVPCALWENEISLVKWCLDKASEALVRSGV